MRSQFVVASIVTFLLTSFTLAAPAPAPAPGNIIVARQSAAGNLYSPVDDTGFYNGDNNGTIFVDYRPTHTPRYYVLKSIDLYLTPYPQSDPSALVANGKQIANQLRLNSNYETHITGTFGISGFCGQYYLVVVENLTPDCTENNVAHTPYINFLC